MLIITLFSPLLLFTLLLLYVLLIFPLKFKFVVILDVFFPFIMFSHPLCAAVNSITEDSNFV